MPSPLAFYYDLASPYAYLAAQRIDGVLGLPVRWVPVVFGAILARYDRIPWSLDSELREPGQREVARRASDRGLPEVRWPEGWPDKSYSVVPSRAVTFAAQRSPQTAKELALALFDVQFVHGRALDDFELVAAAGERCGIEPDELRAGVDSAPVKAALRANTDEAIARGVVGVPTVAVGTSLFWGDDRLEDAAAAMRD